MKTFLTIITLSFLANKLSKTYRNWHFKRNSDKRFNMILANL